jgi:LmbE family N-acetylglucosaminyl deacetylase
MKRHALCIGAHPDDNEICVGGLATRLMARRDWRRVVGLFENDATFDELQAHIEQRRREENESLGIFLEQNR